MSSKPPRGIGILSKAISLNVPSIWFYSPRHLLRSHIYARGRKRTDVDSFSLKSYQAVAYFTEKVCYSRSKARIQNATTVSCSFIKNSESTLYSLPFARRPTQRPTVSLYSGGRGRKNANVDWDGTCCRPWQRLRNIYYGVLCRSLFFFCVGGGRIPLFLTVSENIF